MYTVYFYAVYTKCTKCGSTSVRNKKRGDKSEIYSLRSNKEHENASAREFRPAAPALRPKKAVPSSDSLLGR